MYFNSFSPGIDTFGFEGDQVLDLGPVLPSTEVRLEEVRRENGETSFASRRN